MSFLDDLFGGGGGEPSKIVDTTPDAFEQLRGPVADLLKGILGGRMPTAANVPAQAGNFAAPVTGQEQNFLNLIGQGAGGGPNAGAVNDILGQTLGGKFLSPDSNPFLRSTIEAATRPVIDAFRDNVAPELRSKFTAAGQIVQNEGSSPFARAFAKAGSDLTRQVGDISSRIAAGNFEAERQRQQGAVTQALQVDASTLDNAVQGLQASALPRIIEQFGIDKGIEVFNQQVSVLLEALRLASAVSAPNTISLPGSAGTDVGGLLSGVGSLAFGLGSL